MIDTARLRADETLLQATLAVFRRLELAQQLEVLLHYGLAWTGGACGFGLAPGDESDTMTAVATSLAREDPRLEAIRGLQRRELARLAEGTRRRFDGLGPMAAFAEPWPQAPPPTSLFYPLPTTGGHPVAALWIHLDETGISPGGQERFEQLLDEVAPALANAERVRAMRELVIKDDTAHCFNRRHFESSLPDELSRAGRFNAPLSLIFLDMDNLKEVNTLHGHAMGSQTLREVSRRILAKIRRFDKLFRFGGDEFCIVLPETEWHGALEVAERIRDAIAGRPFLARELPDQQGIRMTASLGIASFPLHARTKEELIQRSDRAMQRIKSGTKNSIGIAEIIGDDHDK